MLKLLPVLPVLLSLSQPSLKVSANFAPEPANITLTVTNIDPAGHWVCSGIEGVYTSKSSCREVDSQVSRERFDYRDLPADTYIAWAAVDDKAAPVQQVLITRSGPE